MAEKVEKRTCKGSYTIEMAFLSGIWLLVIFASLLLLIGTHTRIQNTGTAAESSLYGSSWAVYSSENGKNKAAGLLQGKGNSFSVSGNDEEITTAFSYTLGIPYHNLKWEQTGMVKSKIIRPVLFIEKVEKAKNLIDTIQNR